MKKVIGVMGPGSVKPREAKLAHKIGRLVAEYDAVLLTGGMGGVMEEASRGASEEGGIVLAICPTYEERDLNKYVDIPVMTGMKGARNYMNVLSSDVVVAIGYNSAGTLSEIAFSLQLEKPLIICGASEAMQKYLKQFKNKQLRFAKDIDGVSKLFKKLL